MTFSFSTTVPGTNNDPADDQPIMQTNNVSTSGLISVDHVGFNTPGGGHHEQVTFNDNNVPSVPTSPPVLFTNSVSGLPQLFFYSGTSTQGSGQYISNTNGSTFLLGGIILKWGTFTSTSGTTTVTYTGLSPAVTAFPNNTFSVFVTAASVNGTGVPRVLSVSNTGFQVLASLPASPFYFLAIGN